jgi:hypothetical protein
MPTGPPLHLRPRRACGKGHGASSSKTASSRRSTRFSKRHSRRSSDRLPPEPHRARLPPGRWRQLRRKPLTRWTGCTGPTATSSSRSRPATTPSTEAVAGGFGAYRLTNDYGPILTTRIRTSSASIPGMTIVDADQRVFFDGNSKLYDKSDAGFCFVLTAMTVGRRSRIEYEDRARRPHGRRTLMQAPLRLVHARCRGQGRILRWLRSASRSCSSSPTHLLDEPSSAGGKTSSRRTRSSRHAQDGLDRKREQASVSASRVTNTRYVGAEVLEGSRLHRG